MHKVLITLGDNPPDGQRPDPVSTFQPRILVFEPLVALVQPRDLALEPFALALDALKLAPQSFRLLSPLALGRLLRVSLPSHMLLVSDPRQKYNPNNCIRRRDPVTNY